MLNLLRSTRPADDEYASYYNTYISLVPEGDIVATLINQKADTLLLLGQLSDEQAMFSYAPGKWNIKEVLGHVIDTERVFGFRALWFAHASKEALPSMDQDEFLRHGTHGSRPWRDLVAEYDHLRVSTLDLLGRFDEAAWQRRGVASSNEVSVRALAWMIAGHELHHRRILRERYLQE